MRQCIGTVKQTIAIPVKVNWRQIIFSKNGCQKVFKNNNVKKGKNTNLLKILNVTENEICIGRLKIIDTSVTSTGDYNLASQELVYETHNNICDLMSIMYKTYILQHCIL